MSNVKERPILMSAPMVRAILAGQKTVTRRVVKNFPTSPNGRAVREVVPSLLAHRGDLFDVRFDLDNPRAIRCPYGAPGDRLYVRESLWVSDCGKYLARDTLIPNKVFLDVAERATGKWWLASRYEPTGFEDTDRRFTHPEFPAMVTSWSNLGRRKRSGVWVTAFEQGFCDLDTSVRVRPYGSDPDGKAVLARYTATFRKHLPAIHVPQWASRITLDVVDVRVERLHAIDDEDARREGVDAVSMADVPRRGTLHYRDDFAQLWDKINGERAPWASNPWVWRVEFERVTP